MAEAALRLGDEHGHGRSLDTDLVRRLMARPIRSGTVPAPRVAAPLPSPTEPPPSVAGDAGESSDLARLRSEILVMKAVLRAERAEAATVRASVERLAGPAPVSPEARAVRDRWAALVDQLLDAPR